MGCLNEVEADTDVGGGREEGTQGNLLSDAPLLCDECVAGGSRRRLFLLHAALQSPPDPPRGGPDLQLDLPK